MSVRVYEDAAELQKDLKYWSNACGELHHHGEYDITEDELPEELKWLYDGVWEENPGGVNCYLAALRGTYGILLVTEYHELTDEGKPGEPNNFEQALHVAKVLNRHDGENMACVYEAVFIGFKTGFPGYGKDDNATELFLFMYGPGVNRDAMKARAEVFGAIAYKDDNKDNEDEKKVYGVAMKVNGELDVRVEASSFEEARRIAEDVANTESLTESLKDMTNVEYEAVGAYQGEERVDF